MISNISNMISGGQSPEQKVFNKKKDELGAVVHKQALLWFQNAQCQPAKNSQKEYVYCERKDLKTGESKVCCIDVDKVLENTNIDLELMIKGLSKTELAAYKHYLKENIKAFKNDELKMPADAIKKIEKIKDVKDSRILKVATLQFLGDFICDNEQNKNMLDDKKIKWWS